MPTDAMALRRIDHVRMFVGNARQSAYFYRNAFGFDVVAYAGLETGDEARGLLRPAPGPDHVRAGLAAPARPSRRPPPDRARRRRAVDRAGSRRRGRGVRGRRGPGCAGPRRRRAPSRTNSGRSIWPRSTPMETRRTRFVNRSRYRRRLRAGLQAARPGPLQPAHVPSRRPEGDRPHRRQRRGRQDGRLG